MEILVDSPKFNRRKLSHDVLVFGGSFQGRGWELPGKRAGDFQGRGWERCCRMWMHSLQGFVSYVAVVVVVFGSQENGLV